jgi:CheY-like chemotaxis protein
MTRDRSAHGTLVLVEDDDVVRRVLTVLLEAAGWEVMSAADGRAGLKLATRARPDVVVTDLRMPGLSGIELAQRLEDALDGSSIPVLGITSDGSGLRDTAVRSRCFQQVLEKPLAPEQLLRAVRDATRDPGEQAE